MDRIISLEVPHHGGIHAPFSFQASRDLVEYISNNNLSRQHHFEGLYQFPRKEYKNILGKLGSFHSTHLANYVTGDGIIVFGNTITSDRNYSYKTFFCYYDPSKFNIHSITTALQLYDPYKYLGPYTKIRYFYEKCGETKEAWFYEMNQVKVHKEAYPYIDGDLDEYGDKYFSNEGDPILILQGSPGTGKSKLIKYLTSRINKDDNSIPVDITYTNSQDVIDSDTFFLSFLQNDSDVTILEDLDVNLKSRKDGNTFMQRLLNMSDGIISLNHKKIIISTNITNLREMDEALVRPGRCYDIIKTRALNLQEAEALALKLGKPLIEKASNDGMFTLAEIYKQRTYVKPRGGF